MPERLFSPGQAPRSQTHTRTPLRARDSAQADPAKPALTTMTSKEPWMSRTIARGALFAGAALDERGHLRHAFAQFARRSQFLLVDAGRVPFGGRAGAEGAATADDDHLVAEHRRQDGQHRDLLAAGDLPAGGERRADLVAHLELGEDAELELPVVEECFDLP